MAHKLYWIEEPWLMRIDYFDTITTDDANVVVKTCTEAADKHPVNFLTDVTYVTGVEPAVFSNMGVIKFMRHPNVKWFGTVGTSGIVRLMTPLFMRFVAFKAFNSADEAIAFLQKMVEHQKQEMLQKEMK